MGNSATNKDYNTFHNGNYTQTQNQQSPTFFHHAIAVRPVAVSVAKDILLNGHDCPDKGKNRSGSTDDESLHLYALQFRMYRSTGQSHNFFQAPNVVGNARFHCWRNAQGLMHTGKIVVHERECDSRLMVLNLFGKGICQARESAHRHTHRKVVALGMGCLNTGVFRLAVKVKGSVESNPIPYRYSLAPLKRRRRSLNLVESLFPVGKSFA